MSKIRSEAVGRRRNCPPDVLSATTIQVHLYHRMENGHRRACGYALLSFIEPADSGLRQNYIVG
jgi:hypothetical protein